MTDKVDADMSRVQIITTPRGERLAIVPMEDYEALVEAAADDLAPEEEEALAAEMRRLRADEEGEGLPVEAFRRILAGESALRVWREHRGLTPAALAARVGVSSEDIVKIETSPDAGAIKTLRAIAHELGTALDELVPSEASSRA
jgi:DNA-binding XRE family transcriptional regulator